MSASSPRPSAWSIASAFAIVYVVWGTTYLAIAEGVKTLPPGLFGGVRVGLAGVVLLGFVAVWGRPVRLPRGELRWAALVGGFMFVGGNGLLTAAEKTVPSGAAAVLSTTAPLWVALFEALWPRGERLTGLGWAGLCLGTAGVAVLLWPRLEAPRSLLADAGPLMVLGSSCAWAAGAFTLRHRPPKGDRLTTASYHLILGGGATTLIGLAIGEASQVGPDSITAGAVASFFYLLFVSSIVSFLAFTYLLRHVSATLVGTHAYVNPLVALLVGTALAGETITRNIVGGMVVILTGVALVRAGSTRAVPATEGAPAVPAPQPAGVEASGAA